MHGKRDQNRSVNVLGPAALTLAVPLRFILHVLDVCVCGCVRMCVCDGWPACVCVESRQWADSCG